MFSLCSHNVLTMFSLCSHYVLTMFLPCSHNVLPQTEKEGLQKEVERWGVRCNELIEQCNKVDVKEFNKLQIISNTLRVQLKKSKDDHAAGTVISCTSLQLVELEPLTLLDIPPSLSEVAELQKKNTEISEEGERISGEKGALLGNINRSLHCTCPNCGLQSTSLKALYLI